MKQTTLSIAIALLLSTFSFARENITPTEVLDEPISDTYNDLDFYAGIAYSYIDADIDGTEEGNAYSLLAGYNINENFALEARYSRTFGDMDTEKYGDRERKVTNKALYLKPRYEIVDDLNIYALLGYGQTVARNSSGDGFQWGAGLSYEIEEDLNLFVDYTNIYDDTLEDVDDVIGQNYDSQLNNITVGISYNF